MAGPKDKTFEDDGDDWASAIDEWDANLPFAADAKPKAPAPVPAPDPVPAPAAAAAPTPAAAPVDDEPPALDAAPARAPASDDPLSNLFDGDLDMPETAGEALGALLGDAPPPPAALDGSVDAAELEVLSDVADRDATPAGANDELAGLLEPEVGAPDEFETETVEVSDPEGELPIDAFMPPLAGPSPFVPAHPAAPPARAAEPPEDEDFPEIVSGDFVGNQTTRVASSTEVASLLESVEHTPPIALPMVPAPVASAPAATPAFDDDFYDDIFVEPGRDEPSNPRPAPLPTPAAPPPAAALHLEPPPPIEPLPRRRRQDPDRTPTPFEAPREIDPDLTPLPGEHSAVARHGLAPEVRPVRLRAPATAIGELRLPESRAPRAVSSDEPYLRQQLALLDTERLLAADAARAAHLAHAGGRLAERLGDLDGARDRYEAALELDRGFTPPLRALRRIALRAGKPDALPSLLERELERCSAGERPGLLAYRADLCLALGERDGARTGYKQLAAARPDDLGAALGVCDLAAAEGADDDLAAGVGRLSELLGASTDGRMRSALAVERGRLDEAAGRAREAVAHFRAALETDADAAGAAWGLLRIAVRTTGVGDDVESHARLAALLPRGPLRAAVERRFGLLTWRAGDAAGARPLLQSAASAGDLPPLVELAELEKAEGRLDEAAAALARAVEAPNDPGRRADLLLRLGEINELRGNVGAAAAAFTRAAADYPDDPRAARALERTQAAGDDKESALGRHLNAAQRDAARAPLEWIRAARLLADLGRGAEGLTWLAKALERQPALGPAVELAVELHLAGGDPDAAAGVLVRAADAPSIDEPAQAQLLRERAARLWWKAGKSEAALDAIKPLGSSADGDALPLRWLEQRILRGGGAASAVELAVRLRVEAEAAELNDRARAAELWHERGLLLRASDGAAALESHRRALGLDAAAGPAAVEAAAHLARVGPVADLPSLYSQRLTGAAGRPEQVVLGLRLGASLEADAGDLGGAQRAYAEAADRAPESVRPVAVAALERAARRGEDHAHVVEAIDRELAATPAPSDGARFALLLLAGERQELRLGRVDLAVERYRQALALRPKHQMVRRLLERALATAGNHAALAELALADLKDAPDVRRKVAAYQRLAFIDGELRGDGDSARLAFESILELDPKNQDALRVLEKAHLQKAQDGDLLKLYEQMGGAATDASLAAAVHLDCARLRGRTTPAELDEAAAGDYELALARDPRLRPALRFALARARAGDDHARLAQLWLRLGESAEDDGRTAAICLTRSAEALVRLDRGDDAKARFAAALGNAGLHLPALVGLLQLGLVRRDWASAVDAAEEQGQALRDPTARARAYLIAGAIAHDHLNDPQRALGDLRQTLQLDGRSREAFDRLEKVLLALGDYVALAELYKRRLDIETDGARLIGLHLELARIARDKLGDRESARNELKAVLTQDAAHPEALAALGDLYYEDGQWADAAEALIKRARFEKSRTAFKELFFKLGLIYSQHLPDPKRAVAAFQRVLKADPADMLALEHLANLQLKEWDWQGALETTRRLAELETDTHRRVMHLHRVAKIYEDGFKDARHALDALRAALELDPMYLTSIGELAKFFDRQSDVQSMRVHLDRTAARLRAILDQNPHETVAFHALFKVFGWRRAPDRAAVVAGVLEWMGAADAEEKALLTKVGARDNYPGAALADPTLDENLFDARVPAGFRHLFRLLDEPLGKMFRGDVKRLGLGRGDKLPRAGHPLKDQANRLAADLGVHDFDLYVTAAHPTALLLELTEPVSVVIGQRLVEGAGELEQRFLLGRALKMLQTHMALPMRLSSEELALLVGAIVRQFVPDFVPRGLDERRIVAEAQRMSKVIPKKMHGELLPFALECASSALDLTQIAPALVDAANRAGVLCCGAIGPALTAIKRIGDEGQLRSTLRFSVSDELAELRRQAGASVS
jgi:tetratricopeptide (TPR) repeat protein